MSTALNTLKKYPINLLFLFGYYDKILFTHTRRLELIGLFTAHVLLLIILYISPLIYNNTYFNSFYLILIIAMICGWILFEGECWITMLEKKILDPTYVNGSNLDVNPSIDLISRYVVNGLIKIGLIKQKDIEKINDEHYSKYKSVRYKIPLVIPFVSFVLFLLIRFPKLHMKYKAVLIGLFTTLILISHYRWKNINRKNINNGYHSI